MKKLGLFLVLIILPSLFAAVLIKAQELGDSGLPPEIEKVENTTRSLADQNKTSYLLEEWRKVLLNNPAGAVIVKIWDFLKKPFTAVIGTQAGFTWRFFIALGIWLALLFLVANAIEFLPFSKGTSWIIGLGFVTIFSLLKFIDGIAGFIDNLASVWWGKLIIFILIISSIAFSRKLSKSAKKQKEEKAKLQEEIDRGKLHAEAEIITGS